MAQLNNLLWKDKIKSKGKYFIWIAAFVGGLAAFLNNIKDIREFLDTNGTGLKIVKTNFIKYESRLTNQYGRPIEINKDVSEAISPYDTINIVLRNNGTEGHVLSRVCLYIKKRWVIQPGVPFFHQRIFPVDTFDFLIPDSLVLPKQICAEAELQIKGGESQSFYLTSWAQPPHSNEIYVYLADIELYYNEEDKKIKRKNLLIGTGTNFNYLITANKLNFFRKFLSDEAIKEIQIKNLQTIHIINSVEDGLKDPVVQQTIDYITGKLQ